MVGKTFICLESLYFSWVHQGNIIMFYDAWESILDLIKEQSSGKGTHTPSILKARGITNPPISVSKLLQTPECKELINQGQMISDRYVIELVLHAMLDCDPTVGVLVDGFPRTDVQVEALKMLHDKMTELRREFYNTDRRDQFP